MTSLKQKHSPLILMLFESNHGAITCFTINVLLLVQFSLQTTAQGGTVPNPPEPYPFGPKINKSTTIVMIVLVCVFFILGFLSFYTRRCYHRSQDPSLQTPGPNLRSQRGTRGLDASIIAAFPTFVYSAVKGQKIGKGSLECAVCLNEFSDHETLRLLPNCNHVFHSNCIDAWLDSHSTCPVCRDNLHYKPGDLSFAELLISVDSNEQESHDQDHEPRVVEEGQDANLINPVQGSNQNRPPRSKSTGWQLNTLFPRSHSTGHDSLVRPLENYKRFTLRLPEEVRIQLLNSSLNRARSCVVLPRVESSRSGYRSRSTGRGKNLFLSDRWAFFGRNGSSRSQKAAGGDGDVGEPSFARLRPDRDGQV